MTATSMDRTVLRVAMTQPRIHVVDGTFELYRAEFSKRPRKVAKVNGRDLDVTATVGLVSSLLMLLSDGSERVTHLAYAFDNPIRSFRNDLFADYKDDRGVPEGLRLQFDLVEEVVGSLGVRVWRMVEYEADDALGSAARLFAANEVRILSPDKDLAQCLEGTRVITVDRIRKRVVTHADFVAEKGYSPSFVPDFLALTGDPQDGIPGLPGFGEKTASQLLAVFPGLDAIPDDASKWPAGVRGKEKLARTLAEHREDAQLYKKLATLVTDVPLGVELDDLRVPEFLPDAFVTRATELGSKSLLERAAKVIRKGRVR